MSPPEVGFALLVLGLALLAGKAIRVTSGVVQRLFLPSSIIAGILLLALGPQVLGQVAGRIGLPGLAEAGLFTEPMLTVWAALPGLLISVVFATLFLGQEIPPRVARRLSSGRSCASAWPSAPACMSSAWPWRSSCSCRSSP